MKPNGIRRIQGIFAAIGLVVAFGAGTPVAATAATTTLQVLIDPNGTVTPFVHAVVGLKVRCYGGVSSTNSVQIGIRLQQVRPETPSPGSSVGGGLAVCDGKSHTVAVLVPGNFDAGRALAVVGTDASTEEFTKEITLKVR